MTTLHKTLTVGDLTDSLSTMPRHTPVIIRASLHVPDVGDGEAATFRGEMAVEGVHKSLNQVELEARG